MHAAVFVEWVQPQIAVVAVIGDIDLDAAPMVVTEVGAIVAAAVVLDLSGVEFIDTAGLDALEAARASLQAAGATVGLLRVSPVARRIFELTRSPMLEVAAV